METPPDSPLRQQQEPAARSPVGFVAPLNLAGGSEASESAGKDMDSTHLRSLQRDAAQEPEVTNVDLSLRTSCAAENHLKRKRYDLNFITLDSPQRYSGDTVVPEEELNSEDLDKHTDSANLHSPWRVAAQEPGPSDPNLNAGSPSNMHNSEQPLRSSCASGNLQKQKGYIDSDDTVLEEAVLEEADHSEDLNKMCTSVQDHSAQPQKGILDINAIEKMMQCMQNDEVNSFGKQIQMLVRKRSRELKKKSKRIEDVKGFMIRKKPFLRLVREVAEAQECSLQFSAEAMEALQMYVEAFVVEIFTLSDRLTRHAKRVQLMPADMNLALDICKANYQPIVPPSLIRCQNALGILLVGLPKSGKTSILQKMNLGDIGSSSADDLITRVRFRNITFTKWTLDGSHSVSVPKSIGEKQADVLMYVVDSARSEVFDTARSVLYSILDQEHFRRSLLLVCSHKSDLNDAVSESEIVTHMGLNQLEQRIWHIQCTSTITGNGLYEALDWIVSHLH